jgi:hypothetical protein
MNLISSIASAGIGRKLHGFVERTARSCAAAGEVESGGGGSSSSHTSILHPVEEFLRALVQPAGANLFHQRSNEPMPVISQHQPKLAFCFQTPDHCAAAVDGRIIVRRQQSSSIGSIQYMHLDASKFMKELAEEAHAIVLCGGTMSPVHALLLCFTAISRFTAISCLAAILFDYARRSAILFPTCSLPSRTGSTSRALATLFLRNRYCIPVVLLRLVCLAQHPSCCHVHHVNLLPVINYAGVGLDDSIWTQRPSFSVFIREPKFGSNAQRSRAGPGRDCGERA